MSQSTIARKLAGDQYAKGEFFRFAPRAVISRPAGAWLVSTLCGHRHPAHEWRGLA